MRHLESAGVQSLYNLSSDMAPNWLQLHCLHTFSREKMLPSKLQHLKTKLNKLYYVKRLHPVRADLPYSVKSVKVK